MDLSGIATILQQEYALSKGLLFENHVYGCFTMLEHCIDSSGFFDCSFNQIGVNHGFFKDSRAVFTGSDAYQSLWPTLLSSSQTDAFVDQLEDTIFDFMKDISSVYFTAALETGELPEPLHKEALSFVSSLNPVIAPKRRRLLHTRSRASVTPIKKTKHLSKTRRKPVVEQPKLETPLES
jgi:hypothetical protein